MEAIGGKKKENFLHVPICEMLSLFIVVSEKKDPGEVWEQSACFETGVVLDRTFCLGN